MKRNNLISLLGITIFILGCKDIKENYLPLIDSIPEKKEIKKDSINNSIEKSIQIYEQKNIEHEIEFLNEQRNFYEMRIRECDSLTQIRGDSSMYKLKENYEKKLKEVNKRLNKIN